MELIIDVFKDSWLMLPLLYITYCILEVFERKDSDDRMFFSLQKYGPIFGAVFGLFPQCGFSILAAMLYLQNNITLGTLVAVMIATSDEAIPVLICNPAMFSSLIVLMISKLLIAIAVGYIVDYLLFPKQKIILFQDMEDEDNDLDDSQDGEEESSNLCPCCYKQYPIYISALLRSLKIYAFIFGTSLIFSVLLELIGINNIEKILLTDSFFQPFITALFGFIPNCAITVVLAQLYSLSSLSFGSLLSGLITNAGLSLVCLIRYGINKKDLIRIVAILYVSACLFGVLFMLF
ncbi:MAG: putative manganese transporter [Erysipelotrichaceae bacterium]